MSSEKLTCRFCDRECTLVAAYDAQKKLIALRPEHESGVIACPTGMHTLELCNHPKRVTKPLLRDGQRGEGKWREVSWEEALDYAARRLKDTLTQYGPDSLVLISGFNKPLQGSVFQRMANVLGTPNRLGAGNMCHQAQAQSFVDTFGFSGDRKITTDTRTVLLWGSNPANTMRWVQSDIAKMRRAGGRLVVIDPLPTRMTELADLWLPIRPGTDLALALGMMRLILEREWQDRDFLSCCTQGLDELKKAVEPYTLHYTAEITGLSAKDITQAAQWLACAGPSVIFGGNALDHNYDSYQKGRSLCLLLALTGNVDLQGAAVPMASASPHNPIRNGRLAKRELFTKEIKARAAGYREPLLDTAAQTSGQEMLKAIEAGKLKAGWVMGGDPVVMWANSHKTAKLLGKLDFLLVQDFFVTPTACMADLVLPVATALEYENVFLQADGGVLYRPRAEHSYDVKSDMEIISEIGNRMGLQAHFWPDMEAFWNDLLNDYGIDFSTLRQKKEIKGTLDAVSKPADYREKGFPTPSGKVLLAIPRLAEKGGDSVPVYRPLPQPDSAFPYRCTNYKSPYFFRSAGRQMAGQCRFEPDPIAYISSDLARKEHLSDGDWLFVSTATGESKQRARIAAGMPEGTVALAIGWWDVDAAGLDEMLECACNNLASDTELLGGEIQAFSVRGIPCRVTRISK